MRPRSSTTVSRPRSRLTSFAVFFMLVTLIAAGCGGTGSGGSAAEEGQIDPNGSFVYGYPITVSRLDPHRASISQDGTTLFPAYDRLVHLAPDGELIPGLAESWEFSPDGLTLTMTLRQGVTFHDGATFDAHAAKMNLDRAKTLEGSSVTTDIASIENVEVVDDFTIAIQLSKPDVSVIGALADRAGIQVSPKALEEGVDLDQQMVGAGPFKMVSHTPGATTVFERFDEYWGEPAKVETLEIRVISDQVARLNALRTGEIDGTTVGAIQVAEVENDPSLNLQLNTELQYYYIVQNRSRANQDDLRVRQAMVHALDRKGICQTLFFGYCEVTDQPFPPGYFAFNDKMPKVLYEYDPEKARQLLGEAGVTSMDVSLLVPGGLPTYPEVAQAIQAQWREVGINATIEAAEPSRLGELMFATESADTMLAVWGGRPDPSITFAQRGVSTGFANPGGVSTPEMEQLYLESISTADPAARQEVLRAGSKEMAESVLEFVVLFPKVPYVTGDNVANFTPYITSKPEFRDVAVTG
jgi:peptide/nickel transport system substrate-binding protein